MVSKNYLQSLPFPNSITPIDLNSTRDEMIYASSQLVHNWDIEDYHSNSFDIIDLNVIALGVMVGRINQAQLNNYALYADSDGLKQIGARKGLVWPEGMSHNDFFDLIIYHKINQIRGTPEGIHYAASLYEGTPVFQVVDTSFSFANAGQTINLYALFGKNKENLSQVQRAALQNYMNSPTIKLTTQNFLVKPTIDKDYRIHATVEYDGRITDPTILSDTIRASVYRFIDKYTALNTGIEIEAVHSALWVKDSDDNTDILGLSAYLTLPPATNQISADLDPIVNQTYRCGKDATDVLITLTDVS